MRLAPFTDFLHTVFRHSMYRSFRHKHCFLLFQLKERWQEEDSEIAFAADRADSDDEDPELAPYTPRIDLEDLQVARASKDSDDDDCCIVEPVAAKPLAYALPVGGSAGAAPRSSTQLNAPPATKKTGKKPATKTKKGAPPTMPVLRRSSRAAPVGSG